MPTKWAVKFNMGDNMRDINIFIMPGNTVINDEYVNLNSIKIYLPEIKGAPIISLSDLIKGYINTIESQPIQACKYCKYKFLCNHKNNYCKVENFENISNTVTRIDIDDRDESVGRKIRDAEKEWIPIIIVLGELEREKNSYKPRFRNSNIGENDESYNLENLNEIVEKLMEGFPMQKLPLPLFISKRPKFK